MIDESHIKKELIFLDLTSSDGDGLTDAKEYDEAYTDPRDWDTDDDLMPDGYEHTNACLDPLTEDGGADSDIDGLSNLIEYHEGTDPCDPDSDDDGLADGVEICDGAACVYDPIECWGSEGCAGDSDPLNPDTDSDGINDSQDENPIMGLATEASVAFEGASTSWGRAGSPYRSNPDDPNSTWVPIVITARGEGGSHPRNTLVELTAFEPTNKSPATGQAAGFCADPEDCEPVSPFYAYTDTFGQARAYLVFGAKTYGENPEDDQWGLAGSHYAQVVGITELSVKLMPGTSDEIVVPSSSIPYGGTLYSMADRPAEIRVVAEAFTGSQPFLYASSPGDPIVRVVDRFGNPVANALVEYQVTGGAGKVINRSARECRDNAGDPWAAACNYDESVALQTIEVPDFLDQKLRYGPHYCICHWDEELGTIICPVFLPNKWNVDEQCDSFLWWTDSWGALGADWVLGSEAGQELTVRIMDNNSVTPQVFSGAAMDLPAKEMVPVVLSLEHRYNDSPQYAGVTMAKPFRVVIFYRHDQAERPSAEPLVRVDDDLKTVDKPEGEFGVIFEVDSGRVSDFPVLREEDSGFTEIMLLDSKPLDPTDFARAYWHLSCDEKTAAMDLQARVTTEDSIFVSIFHNTLYYSVVSNPDHCVETEKLWLENEEGEVLTSVPYSPDILFIAMAPSSEGGETISDSQINAEVTTYDDNDNVISQSNVSLLNQDTTGIFKSDPVTVIDRNDALNPCHDGSCGQVIIGDIKGRIVISRNGAVLSYNLTELQFADRNYNDISFFDILDGNTLYFQVKVPKVPNETPPAEGDSVLVSFYRYPPNNMSAPELQIAKKAFYHEDQLSSYYSYRSEFALNEIRGANGEDDSLEIALADATFLTDSFELYKFFKKYKERGIGNKRKVVRMEDGHVEEYYQQPFLTEKYFKSAGVVALKGFKGKLASPVVFAPNQADILFFSGHGAHKNCSIRLNGVDFYASSLVDEDSLPIFWNKDVSIVIFSACSILDIYNYHAWTLYRENPDQYNQWKNDGIKNCGDQWKITGSEYFLGYNWASPQDEEHLFGRFFWQGAAVKIAHDFGYYYNQGTKTALESWADANDPYIRQKAGMNAAAINKYLNESGVISYNYYFWDECGTPEHRWVFRYFTSEADGSWPDNVEEAFKYCEEPPDLPR